MYISMLGVRIESYEHVLGLPRFWFSSKKIIFSRKIRQFFNGLIKKFVKGIKVGSRVCFWRRDARFHTQSILFTPKATFPMFWAAKTSRKALFL